MREKAVGSYKTELASITLPTPIQVALAAPALLLKLSYIHL